MTGWARWRLDAGKGYEEAKSEIDMVLASSEVPKLGEAALETRLSAALRLFTSPA